MAPMRALFSRVGAANHSPMVGPNGSATFPSTATAMVCPPAFANAKTSHWLSRPRPGIGTLCSGIARSNSAPGPRMPATSGGSPPAICHAWAVACAEYPGRQCFSGSAKLAPIVQAGRRDVDHCRSIAPSSVLRRFMVLNPEKVENAPRGRIAARTDTVLRARRRLPHQSLFGFAPATFPLHRRRYPSIYHPDGW